MAEHVPSHAQMEEEQMLEPNNTLVVSASQPTSKYHCNDLGNNEICISIKPNIYIYINLLVFVDDTPLQRPPRPTIRCTRSMVRERMPTQSTERDGTTISTGMTTN